MKISVTGHRGYIGKRVFFRLRMLGLRPMGFDIGDKLRKSDVTIHLAAKLANTKEAFWNNVGLTSEVVRKTRKVVFASSAAVYGDSSGCHKEIDPYIPINLYGQAKVLEESIIVTELNKYAILRLANVYSHDADHGMVALLLKGNWRTLYAKGKRTRDYILVDDVVDVMVEAALTDKWNGIYNIGTGKAITSKKLFKRLCPGKKPIYKEKDEIDHSCLDITKARKNGFNPFTI